METIPDSSGCGSLFTDTADHRFMPKPSELDKTPPSVKSMHTQGHDPTFFGDTDLEIQYDYHSTVNDFIKMLAVKDNVIGSQSEIVNVCQCHPLVKQILCIYYRVLRIYQVHLYKSGIL